MYSGFFNIKRFFNGISVTGRIIKAGKDFSQYFNEYFATITDSLNIPRFATPRYSTLGASFVMLYKKYASHRSVLKRGPLTVNALNSHLLTLLLFSVRSISWIPLKRKFYIILTIL